jgi:hypothetical protein
VSLNSYVGHCPLTDVDLHVVSGVGFTLAFVWLTDMMREGRTASFALNISGSNHTLL